MTVQLKSQRSQPKTVEQRRIPSGVLSTQVTFKLDLPDYLPLAKLAEENHMSLSCAVVQITTALLDELDAVGELDVCTGYRIAKGKTRQQKNVKITFTDAELDRLYNTGEAYGVSAYRLFVSLINSYVATL